MKTIRNLTIILMLLIGTSNMGMKPIIRPSLNDYSWDSEIKIHTPEPKKECVICRIPFEDVFWPFTCPNKTCAKANSICESCLLEWVKRSPQCPMGCTTEIDGIHDHIESRKPYETIIECVSNIGKATALAVGFVYAISPGIMMGIALLHPSSAGYLFK